MAIVFMLLACQVYSMVPQSTSARSIYLPPNLYFVRTTAIRVWGEGGFLKSNGRLQIQHVYGGPARLAGAKFDCGIGNTFHLGSGPGGRIDNAIEDLEFGEEGFWWVAENPDRTVRGAHTTETLEEYGLQWPFRNIKPTPYDAKANATNAANWREGNQWAAAASAVYAAKSDAERQAILYLYASAPKSSVSVWALSLLARGPTTEAVRFFRSRLRDDALAPDAKTRLDALLCRHDGMNWIGSPARRDLFRRWLAVDQADDATYHAGCDRLFTARIAGHGDAAFWVAVLSPSAGDCNRLSANQRYSFGQALASPPVEPQTADDTFDLLTGVLRSAKSPELRRDAAVGLTKHPTIKSVQVKVARALRDRETDEDVKAQLDIVLRPRMIPK